MLVNIVPDGQAVFGTVLLVVARQISFELDNLQVYIYMIPCVVLKDSIT